MSYIECYLIHSVYMKSFKTLLIKARERKRKILTDYDLRFV
jgi:hypothetical protein